MTAAVGIPALVLLEPTVVALFPTTGLALVAAPMALVALLAAAALPVPALPFRAFGRALPVLVLLLLGLATAAVGLARDGVDAAHPAQVSLLYTRDADTGASSWAAGRGASDAWLDGYVHGDPQQIEGSFPTLSIGPYRLGPAPTATVTDPEVTALGSTTAGDVRTVRLRLRASGAATLLALFVDTRGHEIVSARVDGAGLVGGRNRTSSDTQWQWGAYIYGVPAAGVDVELAVRGAGPVPVRVLAHSAGLPSGLADLPATATWTAADYAGETVVARTLRV